MNLRRLFHIPGPKELGWAESDALGLNWLTPFQEGPTWEDWDVYAKKNYPVKYFLAYTLVGFFRPVKWKIGRLGYWFRCHFIPGNQFHILDFRGVDTLSGYSYGYLDPCTIIELAAWAALRIYVEKEEPIDPASWASPEELQEEHLRDQKAKYDEAIELHHWWVKGRAEEKVKEDALYQLVEKARKAHDREAYEAASKPWLEYHRRCEEHAEEQFLRLAKLRPYLWT